MKEIQTAIDIHSSISSTWKILTDFAGYPNWNPIIIQITGEARLGGKLAICVKTGKGRIRVYKPSITKFEENHELRWKGKSLLPGFLNAERIFILNRSSEDSLRLHHSELFSGLGLYFAGDRLFKEVEMSLHQMNEAIKRRVEQAY